MWRVSAKDGQQRLLRPQHPGVEHLQWHGAARCAAESARAVSAARRWPTRDSPGCSAAERRVPSPSAQAHNRAPVIVTRCSTTAEPKTSRKKYSSGFPSRHRVCASSSSSRSGADGDKDDACGLPPPPSVFCSALLVNRTPSIESTPPSSMRSRSTPRA